MHFALALLALAPFTLAQSNSTTTTCNNYAELCAQPYSNVTYLTTHNAYAVGSSIAANQHIGVKDQLDRGVRGLMLDIRHKDPKQPTFTPRLCHSECGFLDAGTLADTLKIIKTWLDANPNNVLTLLFENAGKFTASAIAAAFAEAQLDQQCFTFARPGVWPTLKQMINAKKQVVVFVDDLVPDGDGTPAPPFLLAEYAYAWETPYQIDFKNPTWTCDVDRPKTGPPQVPTPLYVLNHFVYSQLPLTGANGVSTSYPQAAPDVNGPSLKAHVDQCVPQRGKPNFVALDFFEVGDAQKVVSALNNVTPPPEIKDDLAKKKSAGSAVLPTSWLMALMLALFVY